MTTPAAAAAEPDVTAALSRAVHALTRAVDRRVGSFGEFLSSLGVDQADIAAIEAHAVAHPPGS